MTDREDCVKSVEDEQPANAYRPTEILRIFATLLTILYTVHYLRSLSTIRPLGFTALWGNLGTVRSMITVTSSAATKVKELLRVEGEEGMSLRIAVRPGGCSGYSYEMFFDSEKNEADSILERDGITVAIDSESEKLLDGATLDYNDGLTNAGFKITNPSNTRTCGCGQSFS